jgi:7-cyano-7-deazaguanine tRNA-ribosyltransferase
MSFEIRGRDLLARIGRLETKSGTIETPAFLPVVNPATGPLTPGALSKEFSCKVLMTNAYILRKQSNKEIAEKGIRNYMEFDGAVMTDSGAYQILLYGKVDTSPAEVVEYQEQISTDIATILDIPTRWNATRVSAKRSVDETLERARDLSSLRSRDDILWVGPVQGGQYLDLIKHSAETLAEMPFDIHALGSPTPIMEQYHFDVLVEMILTAKASLPVQRPLHLFGAGHPFMFALAVALGCDMFDSASYAIFARKNRYMTEQGTKLLDDLGYLPCSCPTCLKHTPESIAQLPQSEKEEALAKHNLYKSLEEVRRIKQSIREGRLWEYLESQAHSHPSLLQAMKTLKKYENLIEYHSPATKRKGLFFFGELGLSRPEIVRYRKLLFGHYSPPREAKCLVLLPQPSKRPYHKDKEVEALLKVGQRLSPENREVHICFYAAPFGVIPIELDEVYPLSQHEVAVPPDPASIDYVAEQVRDFIAVSPYTEIGLVEDSTWKGAVSQACKGVKKKGKSVTVLRVKDKLAANSLVNLVSTLQKSRATRKAQ